MKSKSDKPSFFEWCEDCMEMCDCDFETAAREYHALYNPEYDADDYDCEEW